MSAPGATHLATPVWSLVFLVFTCNVFFLPAKSAMTPEIVPREQLLSANTLLAVAGIAGTVLGFGMGGWVVDHWGWPAAILMDAGTYGVSVISLALIRYRPRPRPVTEVTVHGYWREIVEGLRVVRGSPAVGLALTALGAVWLGGGFVQVAGIQHIQKVASIPGAERIAGLGGALGVGAALSTWWVNTRGRRVPRPLLLGLGMALAGVWLVAIAVSRRYGKPILFRHHNGLTTDITNNGGFGRFTLTTHEHNAHHGAENDGFTGAYFWPNQFYDYHWPWVLAGFTTINTGATDARAATTIDAPGRPLRTSAIAGCAITASPSQFGATTTNRSTVV